VKGRCTCGAAKLPKNININNVNNKHRHPHPPHLAQAFGHTCYVSQLPVARRLGPVTLPTPNPSPPAATAPSSSAEAPPTRLPRKPWGCNAHAPNLHHKDATGDNRRRRTRRPLRATRPQSPHHRRRQARCQWGEPKPASAAHTRKLLNQATVPKHHPRSATREVEAPGPSGNWAHAARQPQR